MTQDTIINGLPVHLQPFAQTQNTDDYTPQDQAAWRFIVKHLTRQLADTAHPVYLEGLRRTGIALDHIPSIDGMNHCLAQLGWQAIVVDGFIPPAIFMEFQALKILVIAQEMRNADHVFYTPAPDIVHESAGHAPFLVDIDYAEFLQKFGEVGMKAIATRDDLAQYDAVRALSIVKARPNSTPTEIADAETKLQALFDADTTPSEAALLTRLHWWTVEYGLVGTVDNYRIFGAGLISSLGESASCLDNKAVEKRPLTVDAILTPYDITQEQPQLFVTRSCKHLSQVLEEFASSMCYRRGGAESLRTAIDADSLCTAAYDSGMQVSGTFCDVQSDAVGNAIYLRTKGPTQLAYQEKEIIDHGRNTHHTGFGSPIGHLKDFSRCLSLYTIDELKANNIVIGNRVTLDYLSGITVAGVLQHIHRQDHRNLILSFTDCTVTDLRGQILFDPDWGIYDLAVGASITSVYGGVADRKTWQVYKPTPVTETKKPPHDSALMNYYQLIDRQCRSGKMIDSTTTQSLLTALMLYPNEWLLRAEILSIASNTLRPQVINELLLIGQQSTFLRQVTNLAISNINP